MINLLISACLSVTMFVLFRLFPKYGVESRHAIYLNYLVCVLVGFAFAPETATALVTYQPWWYFAAMIGTLFVITFVVMSKSVQQAGITISTVAAKISMVIPVLVNILIINTDIPVTLKLILGLVLAIPSVILCNISATSDGSAVFDWRKLLLPIQLFLQAGIADTLINIANDSHVAAGDKANFTSYVYAVCALWGVLLLTLDIIKGQLINIRSILGGIVLGLPNYFSLYFLIHGLADFENNGAVAFPLVNLMTILLGATVALLAFRDRFSKYNWAGLLIAALCIYLLS